MERNFDFISDRNLGFGSKFGFRIEIWVSNRNLSPGSKFQPDTWIGCKYPKYWGGQLIFSPLLVQVDVSVLMDRKVYDQRKDGCKFCMVLFPKLRAIWTSLAASKNDFFFWRCLPRGRLGGGGPANGGSDQGRFTAEQDRFTFNVVAFVDDSTDGERYTFSSAIERSSFFKPFLWMVLIWMHGELSFRTVWTHDNMISLQWTVEGSPQVHEVSPKSAG